MFSAATKTGSQPSQAANYIEDVFSTYLFTGNGGTQTITNGIDLATYGGLVWEKNRNKAEDNYLIDTVRGNNYLVSNSTSAQASAGTGLTYQTTGFTNTAGWTWNSTNNLTSWTFRKQPKFFDVVTYTGNGTADRQISHSLASAPGMIILKQTSTTGNWAVYHRTQTNNGRLNTTNGFIFGGNFGTPTSTYFVVNPGGGDTTYNASGTTYVAYLFAHDAGGFGTSGTDNVISCGSFTTDGSGNATVNLGYEPQYVMVKASSTTGDWYLFDVMREISQKNSRWLVANTSAAESSGGGTAYLIPNATGFTANNSFFTASTTYIYMAIRRPMKVPTDATTVFKPVAQNGGGTVTTGFPVDLSITPYTRSSPTQYVIDRLRGTSSTASQYLITRSTNAEASNTSGFGFDNNTGYLDSIFTGGGSAVYWNFSRRPGFFDEVCYTGTGSATTQAHNLGVAPELMIVKCRNTAGRSWATYSASLGATQRLLLDTTNAAATSSAYWNDTTPTSSVFTVGTTSYTNASSSTYVAYLFATCPGVSKVGSYTGNGGTQAISCGFTGGARFVLIKRTDSTGDWYVYDTARGMTTLVDPYLLLNSTAAESATLGSVTSTAGGFTVNASILAAINTSGASYIFLAIA